MKTRRSKRAKSKKDSKPSNRGAGAALASSSAQKQDRSNETTTSTASVTTFISKATKPINKEEENQIKEAKKRSVRDAFPVVAPTSKKPKVEVISLLDDSDDEDGGGKMSRSSSNSTIDLIQNSDDGDDEIIILDPEEASVSRTLQSVSATARFALTTAEASLTEDIMEVGTKNAMDLPHMRQHCTKFKFVQDLDRKCLPEKIQGQELNSQFCKKCYCYCCDRPVAECKDWRSHCKASDKGLDGFKWKRTREELKRKNNPTSRSTVDDHDEDDDDGNPSNQLGANLFLMHMMNDLLMDRMDASSDEDSDCYSHLNLGYATGPFQPSEIKAGTNRARSLTQCRKCKWWSRKVCTVNSISDRDWCHACGRVISESCFNKKQSTPYIRKVGDILLGTRQINFRVKARDPRKIQPFDKRWEELEGKEDGWVHDENEMRHDFFRHRISQRPLISTLLHAIPVLSEDRIPDIGRFEPKSTYQRNDNTDEVSGFETEALLLDRRNDKKLLEELHSFDAPPKDPGLGVDLSAKWNEQTQTGVLSVKLHLTKHALDNARSNKRSSFAHLLGVWYSIFPFKLSELTNGLPITCDKMTNEKKASLLSSVTGVRPRILKHTEKEKLSDELDNNEALETYNNEAKEIESTLSFLSSSGKKHIGGVCGSDTSLRGTLCRYYKETLADDLGPIYQSQESDWNVSNFTCALGVSPAGRAMGIDSTHRQMLGPKSNVMPLTKTDGVRSYLEENDLSLALQYFKQQMNQRKNETNSINGLLTHLENLHHEPVEHIDGLNVELFDFQREAVGWANERERTPGGLQSFLWTKVPSEVREWTSLGKTVPVDLYFSPVLDTFSTQKPEDIRGGIIAEQMGLGKTIISLSLILKNPAPERPISGTKVKKYDLASADPPAPNACWPISQPTFDSDPIKRAKYFSRGTLVICNVSLVGQWIDEAKNKLREPGLVYSYHGGSRKRCAMTLAKNAIVVTTYATLASDANFHAKKSNDANYCAPTEQIYWWRIICDESHALKDQSTQVFRAVNNLRAVNKWCVTGTPFNTSLTDLKGQMKFLGLRSVNQYFTVFASKMKSHFRSSRRGSFSVEDDRIGEFIYFMRNIMIRHAIQMKGRSVETNIMSLPPKEEKVISICFSEEERKEYDILEKAAREKYEKYKLRGSSLISKNYLRISSTLMPLRLACSGGQLDEGEIKKKENSTDDVDIEGDTDLECPICLDHIENPRATPCKPIPHVFCKECIESCFSGQQSTDCPSCRAKIKLTDLRAANMLKKATCRNEDNDKNDSRAKGEDGLKPDLKFVKKKKIIDDLIFKSKFERLVIELKRIRDEEPHSKSLVFSQFFSTLQWMKQELPKRGFQFRTLSGEMPMTKRAQALRDFQQDPPTTIFLLSMRSGAVGINLTQANRVFLMEPAMNPALEAQAVGRVYRLGQRKSVQVIRMQIENSLETRMAEMISKKFGEAKKPDPKETECENPGNGNSSVSIASVGHMKRDKPALIEDEFDLLFGL